MFKRHLATAGLALLGSGLPVALTTAAAAAEKSSGGMPQLDPSSFSSQLFWLAVTFTLFLLFAWRVGLPKIARVLEDRRERIERDVSRAAELKDEAESVLAEYERLAAEGRASAQMLIREANELAAADATAEHEKLGRRISGDIEKAERRIDDARKAALEGVGEVAAEIAQSAAEKLMGVKVDKRTATSAATKAAKELQ